MKFTHEDILRFRSKYSVDESTGCWNWKFQKDKDGYGCFGVTENKEWKPIRAHRASYLIEHGHLPEILFVCHHCDNPSCVNPKHLFLDSLLGNSEDMRRKGRGALGQKNGKYTKPWATPRGERHGSKTKPESIRRGESHPLAKLTWNDVCKIREIYATGISKQALARQFRISGIHVSRIVTFKCWKRAA